MIQVFQYAYKHKFTIFRKQTDKVPFDELFLIYFLYLLNVNPFLILIQRLLETFSA